MKECLNVSFGCVGNPIIRSTAFTILQLDNVKNSSKLPSTGRYSTALTIVKTNATLRRTHLIITSAGSAHCQKHTNRKQKDIFWLENPYVNQNLFRSCLSMEFSMSVERTLNKRADVWNKS